MGLRWNPLEDCLSLDKKTEKPVASMQRGILSELHSYFDPLVSPHHSCCGENEFIKAVQQVSLTSDGTILYLMCLRESVYIFLWQLRNLCKREIPRWFTVLTSKFSVTLHVFCDPSKNTYGTIVYITIQHGTYTSFVLAKSCVVLHSAELWSIPQKVLIAVIEGARIAILAQEALAPSLNVMHVWTNSMTVLSWITKPLHRPNVQITFNWNLTNYQCLRRNSKP